ncbi:PRD domain-containing protein [Pseudomonas cerasi]
MNDHRFITHLRYFAERVIAQKNAAQHSDDFYHEMMKFPPQAMSLTCAVRDYIQEKYQFHSPNDELTWIGIHISRLADNGS